MKKIILLLLFSIFLLTGCSYTELNELGIVDTIGLQKEEENYLLTLRMIESDEKESSYQIYQSKGKTLEEAFEHAYLKVQKRIYLSHLEVFLWDESIQEEDLKEITNYFVTNNEIRNDFMVAMIQNGSMLDYITENQEQNLKDLMQVNSEQYGLIGSTTLESFLKNYYNPQKLLLYPTLKVQDKKVEVGTYAYRSHHQIFYLTEEETLSYNLLNHQSKMMILKGHILKNITTYEQVKNKEIIFYILADSEQLKKEELESILQKSVISSKEKEVDFLGLQAILYREKQKEIPLDDLTVSFRITLTERKDQIEP